MRKFVRLLIILNIVLLNASPALRLKLTVLQPDGSKVVLVKGGDELLHYYVTTDGYAVVSDTLGAFRYVQLNKGYPAPGKYIAHEQAARSGEEKSWLMANGVTMQQLRSAQRIDSRSVVPISRSLGREHLGGEVIPVILVQYSDVKFTVSDPMQAFSNQLNAENYTANGSRGSVRDYFVAQSMGRYLPEFDVIGIITLPESRSYYGHNNAAGNDSNADGMVRHAVEMAESEGTDFSKYRDARGRIPIVAVVYAGVGEQSSAVDDAVWAKYVTRSIVTDGGTIYSYLVVNELFYSSSDEAYEMDGIGVFCHEFSHYLGLPDFYNTNGADDIFGLSFWSVMDYGQYWADGKIPVGYTAYEREFMGWMKIDTLCTRKQFCTLNALGSETQNAYYILNDSDATRSEYYILENRQPSTWFPRTLGSGMLVFHVDYDYGSWADNVVNNDPLRQRMTVVPADGVLTKENTARPSDYQGDLFPGLSGNTALSDDTSPSFSPYNGSRLGKFMTCISDSSGVVTFCYMAYGVLPTPQNLKQSCSNGELRLTWDIVPNATTYRIIISGDGIFTREIEVNSPLAVIDNAEMPENAVLEVVAMAENYVDSPPARISSAVSVGIDKISSADIQALCDVYSQDGILLYKNMPVNDLHLLAKGKVYILHYADGHKSKKLFVR